MSEPRWDDKQHQERRYNTSSDSRVSPRCVLFLCLIRNCFLLRVTISTCPKCFSIMLPDPGLREIRATTALLAPLMPLHPFFFFFSYRIRDLKGEVRPSVAAGGGAGALQKAATAKKNPISHFLIPVNSSQRADRDLFAVICCSLSTLFTFYRLSTDGLADMLLLE